MLNAVTVLIPCRAELSRPAAAPPPSRPWKNGSANPGTNHRSAQSTNGLADRRCPYCVEYKHNMVKNLPFSQRTDQTHAPLTAFHVRTIMPPFLKSILTQIATSGHSFGDRAHEMLDVGVIHQSRRSTAATTTTSPHVVVAVSTSHHSHLNNPGDSYQGNCCNGEQTWKKQEHHQPSGSA